MNGEGRRANGGHGAAGTKQRTNAGTEQRARSDGAPPRAAQKLKASEWIRPAGTPARSSADRVAPAIPGGPHR